MEECKKKKKGIHGLTLTPLQRPFYSAPLHTQLLPKDNSESYKARFVEWAERQDPGYREFLLALTESKEAKAC